MSLNIWSFQVPIHQQSCTEGWASPARAQFKRLAQSISKWNVMFWTKEQQIMALLPHSSPYNGFLWFSAVGRVF